MSSSPWQRQPRVSEPIVMSRLNLYGARSRVLGSVQLCSANHMCTRSVVPPAPSYTINSQRTYMCSYVGECICCRNLRWLPAVQVIRAFIQCLDCVFIGTAHGIPPVPPPSLRRYVPVGRVYLECMYIAVSRSCNAIRNCIGSCAHKALQGTLPQVVQSVSTKYSSEHRF